MKDRFLIFTSVSLLTLSALAMGSKPSHIADAQTMPLKDFKCEELIAKSKDDSFALKNLAGLRAHRDCKDFRFDWRALPDLEKRIYSSELELIDPKAKPTQSSLTVAELQRSLRSEKDLSEKFKTYKQLRQKLRNNGKRTESIKVTTDMYNWTLKAWKTNKKLSEHQERLLEAALILSRTLWTEGRTQQAEDILTQTFRNLKTQISLADAYLLRGRIEEQKENFEAALDYYDLALQDNKKMAAPGGFDTNRVLWLKSWILYKTQKWALAEASFKELSEQTSDLSERSRARFYRGRALNKLGQFEESKKQLQAITEDDFFTYYSLVAYQELGQKLPAINQIKTTVKFPINLELTFLDPKMRLFFHELIRFGEVDLAERAVLVLSKNNEDSVNMGLVLAAKAQRYLPLFASFAKVNNDYKRDLLVTQGQHLFPRIYVDKVKAMSEKTSLPTSLIYSIMKQESAFNEKTRSAADAFGLMQVIPKLAKSLAKKYKVPYRTPGDLYDPDINIQLGSYELQDQVRKQNGQLTFVAAAYNAGPNALAGWLKRKNAVEILEFIEDIPFEETRTYVKIIARNKLFYERLENPDVEQSFPVDFLNLPDLKTSTAVISGEGPTERATAPALQETEQTAVSN